MKWYAFTTCMVIPAVLSTSAVPRLLAQDQPAAENVAVEAPQEAPANEGQMAEQPANANGNGNGAQTEQPAVEAAEQPAEVQPAQTEPAQTPAPTTPERPRRTLPVSQPQTGESLSSNGGTPAPVLTPDGKILFHFQNASLESVLIYLSETAGLTIINDVKVAGRVNVFNRQPMTITEALEVLNTVLKEQGYAAVRQGKTLRVIPLDAAKKATIPVHTGGDPQKIAISDEIITQVIPVRYANATQLKNDLAPLIPTYADLSSNASTNTLILTDTSANVRRIVEIIAALDTSLSSVTTVKVFTLQYANASNAARLITEVFKPDTPATGQAGRPQQQGFARFFQGQRGGPGNQQQQQSDGSGPQTRVVASADDRTNTLVVSAPQDLMPLITEVLKDLDANPAQDQAVFVYYLRNAQAANVQNVINSLFGTAGTTGTRTGTTNTSTQRGSNFNSGFGTRSGSTGNTNLGLSSIGTGNRTTGTTGNNRTGAAGATARTTATAAGRLSAGAAQTAADLSGQVFAVADADTNSVLIMTASGNFDRVKELLKELDRPVPQVLIKALLTEVTHSNNTDIGLEFSALNLTSNGNTSVGTDFGIAGITTGGLLVKAFEADFNIAFAALQRVGKLDVLSRPYILASDNQTASIIVGQRVPFINNSRITDNGQTINTITYEDIGIILNVTPHINPDGLVIMDVAPEISSVTGDSVPISDNASAPVFAKRSAQTRVAIQNGHTIVIGGMMQDQKTKTVRKVPLLGDLPLVGYLFQRDQTDVSKTELLIFLTPHVASLPEMLQEMSDGETSRAKIVPKAVAPGVYDEHMRGLQRGVSPEDLDEAAKTSPAEKVGPADR